MRQVYKAKLFGVLIAPRKVRLVADMIRNLSVNQALRALSITHKKSAPIFINLINSALQRSSKDDKSISHLTVDQGRAFKRIKPARRSRVAVIRRRTSHISLIITKNQHGKES